MKTFSLTIMVVALTTLFSFNVCQAQGPYGEINYIKTLPNMGESFLIDMKTSKKLANGRVANKTITSWQLYRRAYPRGSNMDYNYAALSVFPSGVEMKAEGTWDAAFKEMSVKDISDFFTSLNNVRTTVATDLYTYKMGVGAKLLPGEYVQINLINVKKGSNDSYEKLLESLKPVIEECIKGGELKGYNVWKRTYATNIGGESDYAVSFSFSTLDKALSWVSGKTGMADEYKKVFPKDDIANLNTKLNEMRDMVSQELWELVDITD
jgi:heme-degrading monooxygenase HmoA